MQMTASAVTTAASHGNLLARTHLLAWCYCDFVCIAVQIPCHKTSTMIYFNSHGALAHVEDAGNLAVARRPNRATAAICFKV